MVKKLLSVLLCMTMILSCIGTVGFASDETLQSADVSITDAAFSSVIMNIGADETK